jgi:MFS family permease
MAGSFMTLLGDQFTLVALPWLVLSMTQDTLVLGTVLGLLSLPRALFILIGGAVVDRFSPKRVLMVTKFVNALLLGILVLLLATGGLTLWMVYLLALAIGLATAFSIPSGTSMLPHVMQRSQLAAANGIMMGLRQLSMFVGPLLAAVLIAIYGGGSGTLPTGTVTDAKGLSLAFGLDALSFLLSAWTLAQVRLHVSSPTETVQGTRGDSVWTSVLQGLRHVRQDRELLLCFTYWSVVAVLITGPVQIAMPVLVSTQQLGVAALGILLGAHGGGTLLGMALSGARSGMRLGTLGMTLLVVDGVVGLLLAVIGLLGGFMQVSIFTWIQRRTPPALMGRVMSMFMFIFLGLAPLAGAFTGWLMRYVTAAELFAGCGGLLVCVAVGALVGSPLRHIADESLRTSRA